jgi:hypothetical protein
MAQTTNPKQWKWPNIERFQPRWRYMETVEPEYPLMPYAHVVRAPDFARVADRCAELEEQVEVLANQRDELAEETLELMTENQRLRSGIQVATHNYGTLGTIQMIRCSVTGNPSGSDTWMEGHPCKCDGCTLWVLLRSLLEDQADG